LSCPTPVDPSACPAGQVACPCAGAAGSASTFCVPAGAACIEPSAACPKPPSSTPCPLPERCVESSCNSAGPVCAKCATGSVLSGGICVSDITQYCDVCTDAQVTALTKTSICPSGTSCCAGCGRQGICSQVCPDHVCVQTGAASAVTPSCKTPAPADIDSSTNAGSDVTHTVTVPCSDPAIDSIVSTIGTTAQSGVGTDYPGSVTVTKKGCKDSAKRQGSSTLESTIYISGPAADTALNAAVQQLMATQIDVTGASATYQSSSPDSSSGLSGGAIAGIVIGSVAAVVIVLLLAYVVSSSSRDAERY